MSDEDDDKTVILFQNHQWAVTDYGIESVRLSPTYHFNAERLLETRAAGMGELYDWPVHMAEKTWVDIEAFIQAFTKALDIHKNRYTEQVDPDRLKASLAKARQEARQTARER